MEAQLDSPDGIKLGIVRGISYGVFGPPDEFMPQIRALGSRFARVYLTWNECEPEAGRYDWSAADALLAQIEPDDEIWVTVVSVSRWGTKLPSNFLPASPATDTRAYARFVEALVARCGGKVTYWQCNNEPSNPGLWSGSAADYTEQAIAFAAAVRLADPNARIVLGGCGYDVLSAPADAPPRAFFDHVLDHGRSAFDLCDVHLYDDPLRIPEHIESVRAMMRAWGYERPVVVGEHGGPTLLEFPQLEPVMQHVMMEAFAGGGPALDSEDLVAATDEAPDRRAMRTLYAKMTELPLELQMFMQRSAPTLGARRHRIACRETITRPLLALSAGVTRTLCWNLAPEVPNYRDPYNLMGFLSDKLALMDFGPNGRLEKREPAADAFARLAAALEGATAVKRLDTDPKVVAMRVERGDDRDPLHVLWATADPFGGEDLAPNLVELPWDRPNAHVIDAFGATREVTSICGQLSLAVTPTPVLVSVVLSD